MINLNTIVAIIAVIGYALFILYTRKSGTFENYSVANRSVGFFILFASLSANFIGPGFTLGLTREGFSSGYYYMLIAGAYGIGKIIEGLLLAPRLRKKFTRALSIGDVVAGEQGHDNKPLQFLVGTISFGLLVGLSVVMSKAGGEILNNFLGTPKLLGTALITIIVTCYSVFGGLKSTMMTDTVQVIAFLVLLPLLGLFVMASDRFDSNAFVDHAVSLTTAAFRGTPGLTIFGMMITWCLGEMLMPFTVHTILAGKSSGIAKKALFFSGILMIAWLFFMLSLGIITKTVLPAIAGDDQVLLRLSEEYFPAGLFGLFAIAIVGVVMSSQDALINCASVVCTRDMIHVFKPLTGKQSMSYSRIAGILVGILSIIFASFIPSIIDGLQFFYSIWVPSVLVVTIFSIFLKKPSYKAAIFSLLVGTSSSILWSMSRWAELIPNILVGLLLSSLVYVAIQTFLRVPRVNKQGE
jgi:SSS family solute:Na+ symporter